MTDDWVKPSAAGMAALRAERDAARAQIAAALAWLDDFDRYGILDVTAFHAALRRALSGETP